MASNQIGQIEHFVVLMLENRSFDHIFGMRAGVEGILDKHGHPRYSNKDEGGRVVHATGGAPFAIPTKHGKGPFHNVTDVNLQLFGTKTPGNSARATCGGFVASYREALASDTGGQFTNDDVDVVMKSFDNGSLPAITALADNFVLCDRWFSEVPGPTHPNRLYVHAGTSQGFAHNVFRRPFDFPSIYELLQRHRHTWAVYDVDDNDVFPHFTRLENDVANFRKYRPGFAKDVETSGHLPNYSFILPQFLSTHSTVANDQHPPRDVRWGEQLIADVYDVLRGNPDVWNKCALVVTYDEHGGFFDHVVPPTAANPKGASAINPDGIDSPRPDDSFPGPKPIFAFDRLGLRVPALIVSPWVGKGIVHKEPLQHTSILRTVRDRFNIPESLSQREAAAPSFAAVFDQQTARTDAPSKLPRPAEMPVLTPADHHANPGNQWPTSFQRELIDGTIHATRLSHPDSDPAPRTPNTEAELSLLTQRRRTQHRRWLR